NRETIWFRMMRSGLIYDAFYNSIWIDVVDNDMLLKAQFFHMGGVSLEDAIKHIKNIVCINTCNSKFKA
ncbi:MAG: hypothetical protein Q7K43_03525, partial [Candidatus Woesearchaeota archaeon]|nr:hypothetical protein [Candidatus Woesearchaeota archaeon]